MGITKKRGDDISQKELERREKLHNEYKIFFDTVCSFITALILLLPILYFLKYVPNQLDTSYIKSHIIASLQSGFAPEAPERYRYLFTVLLFPIFFFLSYWFFRRRSLDKKNDHWIPYLYLGTFLLGFIIFWVTFGVHPYILKPSYLCTNAFLTCVIAVAIGILIVQYPKLKTYVKTADIVLFIFCACIACLCALYFYTNASISGSFYNSEAYYYPVFEVFHGKTLVVDFTDNYGFYPYLLVPFLKLMGTLTIGKFTALIVIMFFIINFSLLFTLWLNIKNKLIATVGYLSLLFFTIVNPIVQTKGNYWAYQPHRLLFPCMILLIASLWLASKNIKHRQILTITGYVVSSLSIFWNIETGIAVAGSWCLFLIYQNALAYSFTEKRFYIRSVFSIAYAALSFIGAFLMIAIITFARSGHILSIGDCFFKQNVFYSLGFFMLPMPNVIHPWLVLAIVYALGLAISIRNVKFFTGEGPKTPDSKLHAMFFMLSALGAALFVYYQGRSHDLCLLAVLWPGIIIATFFFQNIYDKLSRKKEKGPYKTDIPYRVNVIKYISAVSFFVVFALSVFGQCNTLLSHNALWTDKILHQPYVDTFFDVVKQAKGDSPTIDLLISEPAYYYTLLKIDNPTDIECSPLDWYTPADVEKVFDRLKTTHNKVLIDTEVKKTLSAYDDASLERILSTRFYKTDIDSRAELYTPINS